MRSRNPVIVSAATSALMIASSLAAAVARNTGNAWKGMSSSQARGLRIRFATGRKERLENNLTIIFNRFKKAVSNLKTRRVRQSLAKFGLF
jgi:hypothetical protein